jgi:hypothetical protein
LEGGKSQVNSFDFGEVGARDSAAAAECEMG